LADFILQKLTESPDNKILVSCQSLKKAEKIYKHMCEKFNFEDEEFCFYHGDNFRQEENGEMHITKKKREMLDVNKSWKKAKIVLFTGCISSGIDFSEHPFTTFVGILSHSSGNVDFFIQSLFRVRKYNSKEFYIFAKNYRQHTFLKTSSPNNSFEKMNEWMTISEKKMLKLTDNLQ